MSVVKPKPITKDTDNPVHQSKPEANSCSRLKARENVRKQAAVGVGFIFDSLRKWREFFLANHFA